MPTLRIALPTLRTLVGVSAGGMLGMQIWIQIRIWIWIWGVVMDT